MKQKFKILVVDDDLKNIQVGINFLKKNEDYHLVFATSGEQALKRVKEVDFDLVLLDIIMPTMDGYEVCRRLKADESTRQIPVIFLTAKHEEDSLMKGFELGGADYITKPFNASELNARVKTHLELHHYYKQEIAKLNQLLMYSQKAETIKYITGGIVHDCNNFMISIPGNLSILKKRLEKDGLATSRYQDMFDGMNTAVKQISSLLNKLSDFSGKDQIKNEIVDMNEVVSDLNKIYKGYCRHNITLNVNVFSQPALTVADKLHIEQVLLNMLLNAQHAIQDRPDQEHGLIELTVNSCNGIDHKDLSDDCDYLRITISDNGIGIASETMGKIFDPYFSTRMDNGGTGLGLAVSSAIIRSYNGTIEVESEVGRGSSFHLYLSRHLDEKPL